MSKTTAYRYIWIFSIGFSEGSMDTWIKLKLHLAPSQLSLWMHVFSMPWILYLKINL